MRLLSRPATTTNNLRAVQQMNGSKMANPRYYLRLMNARLMTTAQNHAKTCLITGATSGVGLALSEELAQIGFNAVVGARSTAKSKATVEELKRKHPQVADRFMTSGDMDLDDADVIRKSVDTLGTPVDALVLNAGVSTSKWVTTKSGLDSCFSSKVIGHHILTMELLKQNKIKNGSTVLFTGSELSRGDFTPVPNYTKMAVQGHNGDFQRVIIGAMRGDTAILGSFNRSANYATANLFGELWALAIAPELFARKQIRLMSISPGNVLSTGIMRDNHKAVLAFYRVMLRRFKGDQDPNQVVKDRYLPLLTKPEQFEIERMYASPPNKYTGPLTLQNSPQLMDLKLAHEVVKAIETVSGYTLRESLVATGA